MKSKLPIVRVSLACQTRETVLNWINELGPLVIAFDLNGFPGHMEILTHKPDDVCRYLGGPEKEAELGKGWVSYHPGSYTRSQLAEMVLPE